MGTVNFKEIMISTDGSTCSRLAAEKGIEFARLSGGNGSNGLNVDHQPLYFL